MAWEVGAGKSPVMMELMYQMPDNLNHFVLEGAFRQPILWVNVLGERFMPEDCIANTATTGNAIAQQPRHTCFTIMDEKTLNYYKKNGVDILGVHGPEVFFNFDKGLKQAFDEGYKYAFAANSIEELCQKTGVALAGLQKTIREYNYCCDNGYDFLFNKPRDFLHAVTKPPFYAVQSFPGAYGTLGGVKINYKTEVVTDNYEIIPGLYAIGMDSNALYGDTYPFVLIGNTMAYALNSGRIAAENAVEYIRSLA